jgi:hypothetical protein
MYRTMTGLKALHWANSSSYNTIKVIVTHTIVCFLGLCQHKKPVSTSSLLDLVFSNIKNLNVSISKYPNSYDLPLVSDLN